MNANPEEFGTDPIELQRRLNDVCNRTELRPLLPQRSVGYVPSLDLPFLVDDQGSILMSSDALANPVSAAVVLRQAIELSILLPFISSSSPCDAVTAAWFALTTAKKYANFHFSHQQLRAATLPAYFKQDAPAAIDPLGTAAPEVKQHLKSLLPLQGMDGSLIDRMSSSDWNALSARATSFGAIAGPTEYLITTGGDTRLSISPDSEFSRYGCRRTPNVDLVSFGSSTATAITAQDLEVCERHRQSFVHSAFETRLPQAAAKLAGRIKREILTFCVGSDPRNTSVLLCSSGTDAELFASCLVAEALPGPVTNLVIAPAETGSGVTLAAAGCHYDNRTPLGTKVRKGESILPPQHAAIEVCTIPCRDRRGTLLPRGEFEARIVQAVDRAVASGSCLLHVLDAAKTGWSGPDISLVRQLRNRHGDKLAIIVDACQMRSPKRSLAEYLQLGCLLQVTGSKSFGGPPFSGALLVPEPLRQKFAKLTQCPPGLGDYATRVDWPRDWGVTDQTLNVDYNIGLLLRWSAATRQMRRFAEVPASMRVEILSTLAKTIRSCIADSPAVVPVSSVPASLPARPQRTSPGPTSWDQVPTIFSFRLRGTSAGSSTFLSHAEMKSVHRWLNQDLSQIAEKLGDADEREIAGSIFHIGQPVELCADQRDTFSVLRVSTGARIVSRIYHDLSRGHNVAARLQRECDQIPKLFAKLDWILRRWEQLEAADSATSTTTTDTAAPSQPTRSNPVFKA
ncbi:hypothetical protein FYK55_21140 [Roseiconus nitratireducens]|uniref:Uncharacterized protein n=1 Tax=Roseiconus nitratireducens TaxID=2605748 RepID=A0A5M6CZK6_9BACT|nr:hypothetical protein [Roseiconus nitratireducens]KAA5540513.1 hypothetical protein FYK55_21140 [Roseiconus nitratireducens]